MSQPHLTIMYIDSTTIYRTQNNAHVPYGFLEEGYMVQNPYTSPQCIWVSGKGSTLYQNVQPHDDSFAQSSCGYV